MEQETGASNSQLLWIDWKCKVVSFKSAEGFEVKEFSSYEERLTYVFEKCSNGFRIQ